ncbi:MAG: hypothetical protein ACOYT4_03315 [Nanoarchaeota archaeon]
MKEISDLFSTVKITKAFRVAKIGKDVKLTQISPEDLIKNLEEYTQFDSNDCGQKATCRVMGEEREIYLPFEQAYQLKKFAIDNYLLRNPKIEIDLLNTCENSERRPGRFTAPGELIIKGEIKFTGKYEDGKIIDKLANLIRAIYTS